MNERYDVVIVGSGHGGAQAAIALRQHKFEGAIAIVGDEPDLPYERPPLSKEYLAGEKTFEQILIRPHAFWVERRVEMFLGRRVVQVDPVHRSVTFQDGAKIRYGDLIWAAGGSARRLAGLGQDLVGVHTIRNRADVDKMKAELDLATRVVIIGGGYIGLETAAVLRKLGKQVSVLEALDRVLARVAGEPLSRFYETQHRSHGVEIRLGAKVDYIEHQSGAVTGVRMKDGELLLADLVVVGIGIVPAVEPLRAAGAKGENGVQVDSQCRTSIPNVYAVGDCALHRNPFADGSNIRLESVQNASDQATTVAKILTGAAVEYRSVPWFWSNQYDLRLQTVGLSLGFDDLVVRGEPDARSFSLIYMKAGRVIALDCVNATKDFAQGRALVVHGSRPDRMHLADPDVPLKSIVGMPSLP